MKKLVIATGNKNKIVEIKNLIDGLNIEIVAVEGDFEVEENGKTFYENAYIKAYEAAKIMNLPALADDSGLVVDALNGAPGIYSARYANTNDERIDRVLNELKEFSLNERTARFICSMIIVTPDGQVLHSCEEKCEGVIIDEKRGNKGFGYDPIFYIPELSKTMAELTLEEKNLISHRGKALKCIIDWLKKN